MLYQRYGTHEHDLYSPFYPRSSATFPHVSGRASWLWPMRLSDNFGFRLHTNYFGACFTNNTGSVIGSLTVAYTGEQWRLGTAADSGLPRYFIPS